MTLLAADQQVEHRGPINQRAYSAGVDIIYKGGLVNINTSGYAMAATDTASEVCVGVCLEQCDNSGGSAGDVNVLVGEGLFKLGATGMAQADVGKLCYVSDDATVADKDGPTNDVPVGVVTEYVSATAVWVDVGNKVVTATA